LPYRIGLGEASPRDVKRKGKNSAQRRTPRVHAQRPFRRGDENLKMLENGGLDGEDGGKKKQLVLPVNIAIEDPDKRQSCS